MRTSSTRQRPSLERQVAQIRRELDRLAQRRTLAYVDDDVRPHFPDGIVVAGAPIGAAAPPDPPTDLVLAWSAFFDEISIDASWTAPAAGAASYEIQIREHTGPDPADRQLVDVRTTIATNVRFAARPNTTYDVAVFAIDGLGIPSVALDGTIETGSDVTVPAAPANVAVSAGVRSVVVAWDEVVAADVAGGQGIYEVDLATAADFSAGLRTERTGGTIMAFTDLAVLGTTYYARVRAIDSSGNAGPNSATASSATAGVATDDIVAAGLSAAVIKFGQMSGDRLTANSADISILKTSTLAARVITIGAGGRLQVGTGAPGLFVDDLGIRLFNAVGTRTMFLEAATGIADLAGGLVTGATITGGVIRTAASGARVELSSSAAERLAMYNEAGTLVGALQRESGSTTIELISNGGVALRNIARTAKQNFYCNALFSDAGIFNDGQIDTKADAAGVVIDIKDSANLKVGEVRAQGTSTAFESSNVLLLGCGTGSNARVVVEGTSSTYRAINASAFTVSSDAALKTDIAALDLDPRETVAAIAKAARRYRLKPTGKERQPLQTGLIANDLPAPLRTAPDEDGNEMYDLGAVATVTAVEVDRHGAQLEWLIANAVIRPDAATRPRS